MRIFKLLLALLFLLASVAFASQQASAFYSLDYTPGYSRYYWAPYSYPYFGYYGAYPYYGYGGYLRTVQLDRMLDTVDRSGLVASRERNLQATYGFITANRNDYSRYWPSF